MPPPHFQRPTFGLASCLCVAAALAPVSVDANPARATTNAGTSEGTAYRLDDGAPAYREVHMLYESGGDPARLVLYRCMDGSAFARKILVERTAVTTPDFDFVDGRTGYREGVRTLKGRREVYWRKSADAAERTKLLDIPANAVIDAGFDAMVRAHWSSFSTNAGLSASFLLPSAMRFLKVKIERVKKTPAAGVSHLRMKLDTWYGFAVPDTELDYRDSDRLLQRFKGIGSIRDAHGRNQAVRIEFPGGLRGRHASAGEIEAARRLPLTGRCGA
jgi:hypothetical protein